MDEPSDEVLMLRAGRGDRAACARLVERHLGRVVRLARRMLPRRDEAEDVAQDVFLRVWAAAPRWRPRAHFATWLRCVALNVVRDRLAKRREVTSDDGLEVGDPHPGPAEIAELEELSRHMQRVMRELPAAQRTAVLLCHFRELSSAEASHAMHISVRALESLLARARRAIRKRFGAIPVVRE